jgi:hypothetical protein
MRLRAVTSSPNQAAYPKAPIASSEAGGAGPRSARQPLKQQRLAHVASEGSGLEGDDARLEQAEHQHGNADEEARERTRHADVEQGTPIRKRGSDADERAERADR